jgi:molecular chaperone GrpE
MIEEPSLRIDRLLSDFDLARANAEAAAAQKREMETLLLALIEVIDSLQILERRCRELADSSGLPIPVRSIAIMTRQALKAIEQVGAAPMNSVGGPLDLQRHEVAEVRAAAGVAADTVLEEIQRGYFWREKTIRQAKVVIAGQ